MSKNTGKRRCHYSGDPIITKWTDGLHWTVQYKKCTLAAWKSPKVWILNCLCIVCLCGCFYQILDYFQLCSVWTFFFLSAFFCWKCTLRGTKKFCRKLHQRKYRLLRMLPNASDSPNRRAGGRRSINAPSLDIGYMYKEPVPWVKYVL